MKKIISDYKEMLTKRYVRIYLLYFLFFVVNDPLEQLLVLLMAEKGLTAQHYGYVLSALNAAGIVVPAIIGFLATRYSAYLVSGVALFGGMILPFALSRVKAPMPVMIFAGVFLCVRWFYNDGFGNAINYEIDADVRGKFIAVRDLFLFGGCSVGLFIAGVITKKHSVEQFYSVWGFLYALPLMMLFLVRKHSKREKEKQDAEKKERFSLKDYVPILKNGRVWAYIGVNTFVSVYGCAMSYLPLYAVRIGLSVSNIMSLSSVMLMVNAVMALFVSHLGDTKGRKGLYVFDIAFDMLPALIFMLSHNIYVFGLAIVLTMFKDMFGAASYAYYYDLFPEDNGTALLGVIGSVDSVVGIVMPLLVAFIWGISPQLVFGVGAVGCGMAALIAGIFLPDCKK
jgi:MFS family permease